jgi:hypothetical protein
VDGCSFITFSVIRVSATFIDISAVGAITSSPWKSALLDCNCNAKDYSCRSLDAKHSSWVYFDPPYSPQPHGVPLSFKPEEQRPVTYISPQGDSTYGL